MSGGIFYCRKDFYPLNLRKSFVTVEGTKEWDYVRVDLSIPRCRRGIDQVPINQIRGADNPADVVVVLLAVPVK